MAEATIWDLTELTAPALEDLLAVVDDPGGTPTTKKLALADFAPLTVSNVVVQMFTSGSGTYTPTTGMKKVLAIAVGGGAKGADAVATDEAGGGGGGGGTCIRLLTAAEIGASQPYAVGAAGTGTPNDDGTATTLGTAGALLNAGGGLSGSVTGASTVLGVQAAGGAGGPASNGHLNIPGQPGRVGVIFSTTHGSGGDGGSTAFGTGGEGGISNTVGSAGTVYGAGGGGGHASGSPNRAGGAGAAGLLWLLEFIG